MISCGEPKPPYPDPWVDDGKIWAYYNVTTTESATSLLYTSSTVSAMEVDGVPVTVATSYQFATTGEHLVKFTMSGSTIPNRFMNARTALLRVYFPDIITQFVGGNGAHFNQCTSLTFVRFPANLTNISYQCFNGCTNLVIKNLSLPHITSIGSNGFWRVKITNIVDLGEITEITSNYIFANNSSLKTVILPSAITSIGNNAFNSCGTVDSFTCLAVTPPSLGSNVFLSTTLTKIYVPAGSVQAYKEASGWSSYASKIEAIPTT